MTSHGFSHRTATTLLSGEAKGIRFAHLERLCRILHCLPQDLLDYRPSGRSLNPAHDVLAPLRKSPLKTKGLNSLIVSLPPDEIINLSEEIHARYKKPPEEPAEDQEPDTTEPTEDQEATEPTEGQ